MTALCTPNFRINIARMVNNDSSLSKFLGIPVLKNIGKLGAVDTVVITKLGNLRVNFNHSSEFIPERPISSPQKSNMPRQIKSKGSVT